MLFPNTNAVQQAHPFVLHQGTRRSGADVTRVVLGGFVAAVIVVWVGNTKHSLGSCVRPLLPGPQHTHRTGPMRNSISTQSPTRPQALQHSYTPQTW